jgi:DNA-binding FadR family transcriptional regulator
MAGQDRERHASKLLADALRAQIASGAYPAGARLPSYRQLRDEHDVALNTVQAAIRLLAAEGLVEIRPGSGAYARDKAAGAARPLRAELTELRAALRKSRKDLAAAEEKVAGLLSRLGPDGPAD